MLSSPVVAPDPLTMVSAPAVPVVVARKIAAWGSGDVQNQKVYRYLSIHKGPLSAHIGLMFRDAREIYRTFGKRTKAKICQSPVLYLTNDGPGRGLGDKCFRRAFAGGAGFQ